MKLYRVTLKKIYGNGVEKVSELDFYEDDKEDAIAHVNRIIDEAKKRFNVDMVCIYLEEVK